MTHQRHEELARVKACPKRHTWAEIARFFRTTKEGVRHQWRRYARHEDTTPGPCPMCDDLLDGQEDGPSPMWKERGNYAEAQAGNVTSLEELLAIVKPDLKEWHVLDWGVKRWELGAKLKTGAIHWEDGKIVEGHLNYDGIGKKPLWSVWAKFVRKSPISVTPIIAPVECNVTYPPIMAAPVGATSRGIIIPDSQFGYERDTRTGKLRPFHDRRALDLVAQLVAEMQPARVVVVGDFLDMTVHTDKYIRSPQYYFTTQPAILEAHWYLRRLRELAPKAEIHLMEGNHERRLAAMLEKHYLEACGLRAADEMHLPAALSVPKLLALHKIQVEWHGDYPNDEVWLGPLCCMHGDRVSSSPGGSARAMVDAGDADVVFGHVHRIETVSKRKRTRQGWRTVRGHSLGCTCHTDGRVPGSKRGDNWQQGVGVVEYSDSRYTITPVEIEEGQAIYGGVWTGQDYAGQLRDLWPEWNW